LHDSSLLSAHLHAGINLHDFRSFSPSAFLILIKSMS
jgi:hypothetical protein